MSFIDDFNSRSNILIQHLNTLADGKTVVTMLDEMNKTTLDVIGKVMSNKNFYLIKRMNNVIFMHTSDKGGIWLVQGRGRRRQRHYSK